MKQETKFKDTEIGLIPEDWQFKELKAVTLLITDGKHGDCRNQENSGYFFLSAKDVIDGNLDYSSAREIKKEDFLETHRRTNLQPEDILISNSGTIGRLAIAKENDKTRRTTFQKSVAVIKPNKKIIAPYFLYYWFLAKIKYLKHLAGGTTQQNLLLGDLRKFIIVIPKENEQEAILKILLDLDKRIELLQKQNKTLEAMGQAIFKHWFVDFEFSNEEGEPYKSSGGEMVDSELGEIPKGWRVGSFGDIIEEKRIQIKERKAKVLSAVKSSELVNSEDFFDKQVYSKSIAKYLEVKKYEFAYNPSRINIGSIGMLKKDVLGAVSPIYVVFKCRDVFHYFIENQLKTSVSTI
jgi:type I restriction enzyme S subunit